MDDGLCRYGLDEFKFTESELTTSDIKCHEACQTTDGCTAFSFKTSDGYCAKYHGGPYTYGTGDVDYRCYVIGIPISVGAIDNFSYCNLLYPCHKYLYMFSF